MVNYYQLLGLPFGASAEQVRKAYREYAKHFHPDKHQNSYFFKERFQEMQAAYEALSDETLRRRYDGEFIGTKGAVNALNQELQDERRKAIMFEQRLNEAKTQVEALLAENKALQAARKEPESKPKGRWSN